MAVTLGSKRSRPLSSPGSAEQAAPCSGRHWRPAGWRAQRTPPGAQWLKTTPPARAIAALYDFARQPEQANADLSALRFTDRIVFYAPPGAWLLLPLACSSSSLSDDSDQPHLFGQLWGVLGVTAAGLLLWAAAPLSMRRTRRASRAEAHRERVAQQLVRHRDHLLAVSLLIHAPALDEAIAAMHRLTLSDPAHTTAEAQRDRIRAAIRDHKPSPPET